MTGTDTSPPRLAPNDLKHLLHDRIAKRARALWVKYGKPAGRDEMIWLEAERQLLGTDLNRRLKTMLAAAGAGEPGKAWQK